MSEKNHAPAQPAAWSHTPDQTRIETFADFGLPAQLLETLSKESFITPTPIQLMAIPALLEGRDLAGLAQTGTGKTAAFLLPIITHLMVGEPVRPGQSPRALILAPTRELANQLRDNTRKLVMDLNLRHLAVFGGARYDEQIGGLRRGVDIVIATPGRLEDLMKRGVIQLDAISHFVLDEADHMLDLGFYPAMKRISAALPDHHQTMLFSATMPQEIRKLTAEFLTDPVEVKAPQSGNIADKINQRTILMPEKEKGQALAELLGNHPDEQVLVFVRTKRRADMLASNMATRGFAIDALHGDMNQRIRQKVLNKFRRGDLRALIATDVAARGIDVAGIGLVVNFDLSDTPETYVHRIGRTGRAGLTGLAVSFCAPDETRKLRPILAIAGERMVITDAEGRQVDDVSVSGNRSARARPPARQRRKPEQPARPRRDKSRQERSARPDAPRPNPRKGKTPDKRPRHAAEDDFAKVVTEAKPGRKKPSPGKDRAAKPHKPGKSSKARNPAKAGRSSVKRGKPGGFGRLKRSKKSSRG
ncbi:DEAD/DEAH box helicase [Alphaproteobacteria bacterium LSUCC0684]